MRKNSYKESDVDHTLFIKQKTKEVTTLIVYVDDMMVTENDPSEITTLKNNWQPSLNSRIWVT